MAKAKRINLSQLGDFAARKEPFEANQTRGGNFVAGTGRLPEPHASQFRSDNPDYVVRHHATPLAWHGDKGWVVPPVRYSKTSSRRQNAIRRSVHFADGANGAHA